MARINIDMEFFSDNRFEFLADLLGEHPWMARYRMILLWRGLYLKRTSKVHFQDLIRMCWWRGDAQKLINAMIESDLAEQTDDEILSIKGIDKRIAYLNKQAEKGKRGALAKHSRSQDSATKNVANSGTSQPDAMANSGRCLAVAKKSSGLPLALSLSPAPAPAPALSPAPALDKIQTPFSAPEGGSISSEQQVEVQGENAKAEKPAEKAKAKTPDQPPGVSEQVWLDFLASRKSQKAPLTETALRGIVREAERAGVSLEAALTECVVRGWRGFKADWVAGKSLAADPAKADEPIDWTNGGRL